MKTVGNTLRLAREKKNISLEVVSDSLKIRVKYLEALEIGNYSIFPSPLYIKGFIKNYAKYLGLDQNEMLALYRREYTEDTSKQNGTIFSPAPVVKTIKFALKPGYIVTFLTVLVVFFISAYLLYEYRLFSAPPLLQVNSPANNQTVNTSDVIVSGTTNSGNKISINGSQIQDITDNGSFSTSVVLHGGTNELIITAVNSLNRAVSVRRTVVYSNQATSLSPTQQQLQQAMRASLQIVNSDTYIKITADEKILYSGVLVKGHSKTFSADNTIDIVTGNSVNTNLSINGQNVSITGTGTVEKLITANPDGTFSVQ